jgi:hypothetical protein
MSVSTEERLMKTRCGRGERHDWHACGLGVLLGLALCSLLAVAADPGLSIRQSATNEVQITITNAQTGAAFEIQRRLVFDDAHLWATHLVGTVGQTSFVAEMGIELQGYFRALGCLDCDGDGVTNWLDGDPFSTNAGALFIKINSPTNGQTLN